MISLPVFLDLFISSVTVLFFLLSIFQADMAVEVMRQHFQVSSLEYVCKLQEIQERKKFECVEPVSAWPFVQIVIQLDSVQHSLLSCLTSTASDMLSLIAKKERKHIYWNALSMQLHQNKCYKYTFLCIHIHHFISIQVVVCNFCTASSIKQNSKNKGYVWNERILSLCHVVGKYYAKLI